MKMFVYAVLAAACAPPLVACDLCAIYAASESRGEIGKGVFAGAAEQFTHFGSLRQDGREIPNTANQSLDSSITQVLLGYNFNERFGLQFNAPIIHRSFRRAEGAGVETGTESGVGDVSLTGHLQVFRHESRHHTFAWNVLGGIKAPTGSTSRIAEELNETEPGPDDIPSGIHGHDLTLGSGSWDGIVGTSIFARCHRVFFGAAMQYTIRTRGDYGYEFANDLTWSGGPGVLLFLNDTFTLSLQANASGETKPRDNLSGVAADDTGITAVYLGPELVATWRRHLSAEMGVDLPVVMHNTALQAVPDYRVRGALTWHF